MLIFLYLFYLGKAFDTIIKDANSFGNNSFIFFVFYIKLNHIQNTKTKQNKKSFKNLKWEYRNTTNGEKNLSGWVCCHNIVICLSKQQSSECNVLDANEKLGEPSLT